MTDPLLDKSLGSWKILSVLGRGGMATVYSATEAETGRRGALKWMNPGLHDEEAIARFAREFRLLSQLSHPNLISVYDNGVHEGRPWYAMELVEGIDIRKIIETELAQMPASDRFELAEQVLRQAGAALEYIHQRHLVHRDLTPGNLMRLTNGTIKLMDFGVVKETGADLTSHGEFLGTVAYVAPEQIQGHPVDNRADLYSLGAVLYTLLTGRRPFNARTLAGFLDKQLHQNPRPPHELQPNVPAILEDICLQLLQKDPNRRFPSATHILALMDDRSPLGNLPLVGRNVETALLAERVIRCGDGRGGVLLITGGAGTGKARMSRLAVDIAHRNAIMAIRTHASPSDFPLGAFSRLFDALAEAGITGPRNLAESFRGGSLERHVVYSTYRELLMGTRNHPRVLVLEDLHSLDASSWDLLFYLIRNTVALSAQPVLWVLTSIPNPEDARLNALIEQFHPQRLSLSPLESEDVEELLRWMVGNTPVSKALAQRIHADSEGNQGFIQEILRGLADEGLLKREQDGHWSLGLDAAQIERSSLPIPRSIRAALEGRILQLSPQARRIAEVLAVAYQELPPSVIAEVTDTTETAVLDILNNLIVQGLVRHCPPDSQFGVTRYGLLQSRLQDLFLARMSEAEQQGIHRRIGGVLERLGRHYPQVVLESLAWHFEQGRSAGKGYAYLGRAGSKRLERGFMMDAADFFARALALEPEARQHLPLDEADHKLGELLLARASALEHLGRWEETTADLSRALQLGEELQDNRLKARACGELGQQARQQGEGERALQHALEAIRLADAAGDPILRITPLQVLAGVNWNRGDLEEARRYWTELLAVGESSRDQRAIAFGYNGLGLAALCKGQTAEARRSFEQSALVFETLGLAGPLGLARGNLVEIHHFTGNMRRGLELSEKARQHARETHNLPGEARSLCYKALILNDLERHDEAVAAADEGLRQMLSQADLSDELFARVVRLRAAFSLMDWDRIADELDACSELLPQHDSEGFAPLILAWRARVVARQDQAEARRLLLEAQSWTGRLWPYQECRLDLALARGYADVGDSAEATRRAEAGIRRADACGFRLYALKGHCLATLSADEAAASRHRRIADGLAKSLAASLSREDAERFLSARWLHPEAA